MIVAVIPEMESRGAGWFTVTCSNCYHVYLWFDEDKCHCTKCGVHYWRVELTTLTGECNA